MCGGRCSRTEAGTELARVQQDLNTVRPPTSHNAAVSVHVHTYSKFDPAMSAGA